MNCREPITHRKIIDSLGDAVLVIDTENYTIIDVNPETIAPIFEAIENHAMKFCPTGGNCLKEKEENT